MADTKLDEFHSHEVLHTLHVVRNLIERELSEHPFTVAHPVVKAAISRAQRALGTAYQLTGAIEFEADAASGVMVVSAPEPCPRGEDRPEPSCTNRHQCWEPCGELGHSAEHARVGRTDPAEVKRILGAQEAPHA